MTRLITNKSIWLSAAVLLLALLPRVTTLGGTFIVNDETLYWNWTNDFTRALLNLDWAGTLVGKGYPLVTVFWVHALGLLIHYLGDLWQGHSAGFWQRAGLDQPFVFDLLGQRRLVMGLANTLLIWLIYFQARALLGQTIAFLGATMMALTPFLLADARTMRGDALLSSLMLVSLLAFLLFLQTGRWPQLMGSAVALGLAILTKITAIPLAGWAGLAMLVYLWQRNELKHPARLRWAVLVLAVWGALTALMIFAFWPALWVEPLAVFAFIRDYAASSIDGRLNYFWGHLTENEPLPLFYPNAFLFRATPLMVLGVAIVSGLALVSLRRNLASNLFKGGITSRWRTSDKNVMARAISTAASKETAAPAARSDMNQVLWQMPIPARWTLLALGAYAIIYWLILNAGALKRDRYLLPVFPAASLMAAAGLWWVVSYMGRRWPGQKLPILLAGGRWVWAIFAVLLAAEIGHIFTTHPFYYTYWSPLMGGGSVAVEAMMAEGGVETSALVELSQRPEAKNERVALLFSRDFAPAYAGQTVHISQDDPWITANHILLRQYHFQTEKLDQPLLEYFYRRPPERVVEFQGYPWGWVYPGPAAQYFSGSLLDGKAQLLGYNLSNDRASPEQPLRLKLFWRNKGYQSPEHIFIRLVDTAGFVWAETQAQPLPEFEVAASQPEAVVEGEALLKIPVGTPPGLYFLKMGVAGTPGEPDIGEFALPDEGNRIVLEKAAVPLDVTLTWPVEQTLGQVLTLLGVEAPSPLPLTPQTPQRLTLYWQAAQNVPRDYSLLLRLIDSAGNEQAAWSGPPARGLYPSSQWRQNEIIRDPWILNLSQAAKPDKTIVPGSYTLSLSLVDSQSQQQVDQLRLGQLDVSDRLRLFQPPIMAHPLQAQWGSAIRLTGYDLTQAPLTGGARFTLKLYWQARQPILDDYTVFTQVLGPDGAVVGQHDGVPVEGTLPTTAWEAGEFVADRHQLDFSTIQPGQYRLITGLYDSLSGIRLPLTDANGSPAGDFLQLYTFTVDPETNRQTP